MIETATGSIHIKELEKLLQKHIDSERFPIVSSRVSCLQREKTLMILVQYPEPVMPYPKRVFSLLRKTLASLQISPLYQVLIYLVVYGEHQSDIPFFDHNLLDQEFDSLETSKEIPLGLEEQPLDLLQEGTKVKIPDSLISETNAILLSLPVSESITERKHSSWFAAFQKNPEKIEKLKSSFIFALPTGISMIIFLGLMYLLTRPCVTGQCPEIASAQKLAAKSTTIDQKDLANTQQELLQSIKILQTIPSWSTNEEEVKNLLRTYQARLDNLQKISTAIATAKEAVNQNPQPPLPLTQWQQITNLWQNSIATLQSIPNNSEYYQFAQGKIEEYQKNLAATEKNQEAEQKAVEMIASAIDAAKLGEVRSSVAQSLGNWQLVEATWQTAINRLKDIPAKTSVYTEGQTLLKSYMSKVAEARQRKNLEQLAVNYYNQATNEAKLAKNSETINQWTLAISYWSNALNILKQLPQNSFQYRQAQDLINSYTDALKWAQVKQQASLDLQRVCFGSIVICQYNIQDKAITLVLTPGYVEQVWQTANQAKTQQNVQTESELMAHLSSLEQILQALSNSTKIPIKVYNSQRVLLITYIPR